MEEAGPLDGRGVVMAFGDWDATAGQLVASRLDHVYLNDLIDNPTAELVACLIGDWLNEAAVPWTTLRLWETERGSVSPKSRSATCGRSAFHEGAAMRLRDCAAGLLSTAPRRSGGGCPPVVVDDRCCHELSAPQQLGARSETSSPLIPGEDAPADTV